MVDLDETLYGGDDVVDDIDSILLNLISSAIPEWPTFKLLRLFQTLNRLVDLDETLFAGDGIQYYLDYILFNPIASTIPRY
jgi:hypothetical protein